MYPCNILNYGKFPVLLQEYNPLIYIPTLRCNQGLVTDEFSTRDHMVVAYQLHERAPIHPLGGTFILSLDSVLNECLLTRI